MARNPALNIADHGFAVAGYDREKEKAESLEAGKEATHTIRTAADIEKFIDLLDLHLKTQKRKENQLESI
jgi:6-phosphogluconate dehydrogenase